MVNVVGGSGQESVDKSGDLEGASAESGVYRLEAGDEDQQTPRRTRYSDRLELGDDLNMLFADV